MKVSRGQSLPLTPLLRSYLEGRVLTGAHLGELPGLGPRIRAILAAPADFFTAAFLDHAAEAEFRTVLVHFYEQCVQPPLHVQTLRRQAGFLRHALAYLLRSPEPLPRKTERCLAADGPHRVVGLGRHGPPSVCRTHRRGRSRKEIMSIDLIRQVRERLLALWCASLARGPTPVDPVDAVFS
jgi:hypothetical protein